ncbi:hypothetical protein PHIN109289_15155 [Phaeobacter inhibens]
MGKMGACRFRPSVGEVGRRGQLRLSTVWRCLLHRRQLFGSAISRLASSKLSTVAISRNTAPKPHATGVE